MAFVVKQKINGRDYYYLRKSVREGDKVKSKMIAYLGKDKKEADKKAREIIKKMESGREIEKEKERKIRVGAVKLESEFFNNLKRNWWEHFVLTKDNMVGIDASIVSHPLTWKASGHIENFNVNDFLVTCKKCKKSNKVDRPDLGKIKCECGGEYDWEKAQVVEQMLKTKIGAIDKVEAYLRGETAQSMFMDFKLIQQTSRMQLPFGVAQIGRCFRNEIAPRDFLFRCREFHIGEFEFFIHPDEKKCDLLTKEHLNLKLRLLDAEAQEKGSEELKETTVGQMLKEDKLGEWHAYLLAEQIFWFYNLGLEEIKIREHTKDELSHYSSATFDIDYEYPFGSNEVAGNANRGQYDLTQHEKESKKDLGIFDEKTKKKIIPRVIEPTFGMERVFLAVLTKAYSKNQKGEIVLRLPKKLAPIKVAVFPIVKKPEFEKIARGVIEDLRKEWNVIYDKSGSIGRRYARNDEIGTPYCITVDNDSVKNKDVTIRDRDTTKQIRVKIDVLRNIIRELINKEIKFENAGRLVK